MRIPADITYRNVEKTDALETLIHEKLAKLDEVCDHIMGCHIAIEQVHTNPQEGSPYRVRIDMTVPPQHELAVVKSPNEGVQYDSLESVIRDAFDAARKQLKKLTERQHQKVKHHPEQVTGGIVTQLFASEDYGFIKTLDSQDIYFNRNSVLNDDFERLTVGTGVRFFVVEGVEGPRASTVQIVDKPGVSSEKVEEHHVDVPEGWGA